MIYIEKTLSSQIVLTAFYVKPFTYRSFSVGRNKKLILFTNAEDSRTVNTRLILLVKYF
jgi:hypothetical protein